MTQIRTSPSHNGRYNRNDRKKVLEYLQRSNMLTMTQVAEQYNLSPSTVHHWVHRYLPKEIANTIVQRGHNIRGVQISKTAQFRARKQIDQYKSPRQLNTPSVKQTLLNMKAQIEEMLKHV